MYPKTIPLILLIIFCLILPGCTPGGEPKLESPEATIDWESMVQKARPTPTPPPPVKLDLGSKLDNQGALSEDLEIITQDGRATLFLKKGTLISDPNQQVVTELVIEAVSIEVNTHDYHAVGWTYSFKPENIKFNPSGEVTINYDINNFPPEPYCNPRKPLAGYFDFNKKNWKTIDSKADIEAKTMTFLFTETGSFSVLCRLNYPVPMSSIPKDTLLSFILLKLNG